MKTIGGWLTRAGVASAFAAMLTGTLLSNPAAAATGNWKTLSFCGDPTACGYPAHHHTAYTSVNGAAMWSNVSWEYWRDGGYAHEIDLVTYDTRADGHSVAAQVRYWVLRDGEWHERTGWAATNTRGNHTRVTWTGLSRYPMNEVHARVCVKEGNKVLRCGPWEKG
jgi:hypothetical protein